jgi:hypothetical protein
MTQTNIVDAKKNSTALWRHGHTASYCIRYKNLLYSQMNQLNFVLQAELN